VVENLVDAVVRYALTADAATLSEDVLTASTNLLLDAVGVGLVGKTNPDASRALNVVKTWGSAAEASAWGTSGSRLPAGSASFVNAFQMHCLEFDAIHEPSVVHPTTVVFPVIAAWTQREKAQGNVISGAKFLTAFAVGVDVAAGLGRAASTPLQFFRPATAGALGSVAALSNLRQVAPDVAASSFGVVYGALSGTMQPHTEGAQVLALQIGFNARSAIHSFDLAESGFQGPRLILEGKYGYFRLIEAGGDPISFVERLGHQSEAAATSIKPFPSGRATHAVLDAILGLRSENDLTVKDVAKVEISVPPMVYDLVGRPASEGLTPGAARLCLPYLVFWILQHGSVDVNTYSSDRLRDSEALSFAARVTVFPDDNPDPNAFNPQTVRLFLQDGTVLERTMTATLGSPERPLTEEDLLRKVNDNLALGGRANVASAIVDNVRGILDLEDVTQLLDLM